MIERSFVDIRKSSKKNMQNRENLEKELNKICSQIAASRKSVQRLQKAMLDKHNVSAGLTNHYIMAMGSFENLSVEELLWYSIEILRLAKEEKLSSESIESYFTNQEITAFSNSKKEITEENMYPITLNPLLKVSEDQWVMVSDVNFLKKLYDKQVIQYNPNTQRKMKRKEVGDEVMFTISVNRKSVNEIKKETLSGDFIPNMITLNLNTDNPSLNFQVIDEDSIMIKEGQLDIIDGFHRYLSYIENKLIHQDFNYPIIIQITAFDEEKANKYIAQEDKRNKINKLYVKSLDANNPTFLVVKKIKESQILKDKIDKHDNSQIAQQDLFYIIDYLFDVQNTMDAISISKYLVKYLEELYFQYSEFVIKPKITFKELVIIIFILKKYYRIDTEINIIELISNCLKEEDKILDSYFLSKITKVTLKHLENFVEIISEKMSKQK